MNTEQLARFINDPDTHTLGDDFQVLRPKNLANGATVLAYYPESSKSGIVLAHWNCHEFVTWRACWVVDGEGLAKWDCYNGHYFPGLDSEHEAWQDFMKRARMRDIDAMEETDDQPG